MKGKWILPESGEQCSSAQVFSKAASTKAVLLGEQHDRMDNHLWQLYVLENLYRLNSNIVVSYEMFPARLNPVLAQWSAGELDQETFLEKSEWKECWGFDASLYMPLFQFCKNNRVLMIGLNCRRGLVSEVGKFDWTGIDEADREGLTPSRPATEAYRRYLFAVTGGGRPDRKATTPEDPAFDRFVRAQQTWDRAFACRIADAVKSVDEPLVVGIIGRGHLEFRHGTPFQLDDLGIDNVTVLLPSDDASNLSPDIADAVFEIYNAA